MARSLNLTYGSNPERLFIVTDEFGEFALVLADTFEEAYEEALCIMHERDGDCDHGGDPDQENCDCSMSDDGPVWDVYLGLTDTKRTIEWVEAAYGEDVESIDRDQLLADLAA